MVLFFFVAGAFLAAIMAITIWIWSRKPTARGEPTDPEWQVLLAKRDEIERDVLLSAEVREALRVEWAEVADRVLSQRSNSAGSLPAGATASTTNARGERPAALGLAVSGALLGAVLYSAIGNWQPTALETTNPSSGALGAAQEPGRATAKNPSQQPADGASLAQRITALEQRLKDQPDDLEAWVLLARSRASERNFAASAAALEKALGLAPGHPDLLTELADASAMVAGRKLEGRPLELIQQALRTDPEHRKALALAATAAMQAQDLQQAASYWLRLRATFDPASPEIARVDEILASLGTAASRANASPPASGATRITGTVSLGELIRADLATKPLPASAMLFVVAKVPNGPPMPVAVARLPVAKLTAGQSITFQLDDSQAMAPSLKLSSAPVVDLEARVSLSGTAGRQAGDLFTLQPSVKVGTHDLHLVIQSVVP